MKPTDEIRNVADGKLTLVFRDYKTADELVEHVVTMFQDATDDELTTARNICRASSENTGLMADALDDLLHARDIYS